MTSCKPIHWSAGLGFGAIVQKRYELDASAPTAANIFLRLLCSEELTRGNSGKGLPSTAKAADNHELIRLKDSVSVYVVTTADRVNLYNSSMNATA